MQTSDPVGDTSTDETQNTWSADETISAAAANEPIIITGGSIEIHLNKTIFPPDTANPHKNKNAGKTLRRLTVAKKTSPNSPCMIVDLQSVDSGQCIITVEYD
jgi:hypothetical protein